MKYVFQTSFRCSWLRLGLRGQYKEVISPAIKFATSQGRMKYCRPLFRYCYTNATDTSLFHVLIYFPIHCRDLYHWEETRKAAVEAYEQVKDQWMHVCAYTVGKDIKVIQ